MGMRSISLLAPKLIVDENESKYGFMGLTKDKSFGTSRKYSAEKD